MKHKKHLYREYKILEDHWIDAFQSEHVTFRIYDDQDGYLGQELTLNRAKDWVDAEQAGEHD